MRGQSVYSMKKIWYLLTGLLLCSVLCLIWLEHGSSMEERAGKDKAHSNAAVARVGDESEGKTTQNSASGVQEVGRLSSPKLLLALRPVFPAEHPVVKELTEDQLNVLYIIAWSYREQVNQVLAASSKIERSSASERIVATAGQPAMARLLEANFYSELDAKLGPATANKLRSQELRIFLASAMDGWGGASLGFQFTLSEDAAHSASVRYSVFSDNNRKIENGVVYPTAYFERLYGPFAASVLR